MADLTNTKLKFKVGASFFALAFLMLITKNAFFFGNYIVAVVIHEAAHAFAARKLGYKTQSICLSAFGAVLYGDFSCVERGDEIKIALSGPLSNLCLAICTLALWWIYPPSYVLTQPFYLANMSIFAVNLLPCYPLDGGRVLLALLGKKMGVQKAKKMFSAIGMAFSALFMALFFAVWAFARINLTFGLFSLFLFAGAAGMSKQSVYRRATALSSHVGKLSRGVEVKTFVVSQDVTVAGLLRLQSGSYLANIEVVDEKLNVVAAFAYDETDKLLLNYPLDARLKDVDLQTDLLL